MNILGISCYYHDSAAAIIKDGKVIAASEEERFTRVKHDHSFPKESISFCLKRAKLDKKDIDFVVFYEKPFRKFHRIIISLLAGYPKTSIVFREAMLSWLTQKLWIKQDIESYLDIDPKKILFTKHHKAHAAACFYPSPFEEAAILTVDGVGEWSTASYGEGRGNDIVLQKELRYPHSLGLFYSAYTAFLGFEVNEGEWKVMGLAPYGKPKYVKEVWKTIKMKEDGGIELDMSYFSFHESDKRSFSDKFISLFGAPIDPKESHLVNGRSADLAASVQKVTEDILLSMAKHLKVTTKMKNLCFGGGVALNSVANYKILRGSGFDNVYIQSSPGDSGAAIGAALAVYFDKNKSAKREKIVHAYFGESYNETEAKDAFNSKGYKPKKFSEKDLVSYIVGKLTEGKVIGLMQGRFEWGPRALGDRSILADARRFDMKDIINSKVKFREQFRPFAPSVLGEKAHMVFDLPKNPERHIPLRFMQYVVPVKKDWRKRVPAINHADNTARPQLVYKDDNPLYWTLINEFYKKTGVPLVLNTSFNLRGEPIVSSPHDAISTYERSGIDVLVIGGYVVDKGS